MSPAAKQGDKVVGTDIHIIMIPSPGGPVPTPLPHPFTGTITGACSPNVLIGGMPAATLGSTATNMPPHIPQGGPFQLPPTNTGIVMKGSATVLINNKPAARTGDTVNTCNDPAPAPTSSIVAVSTVLIGG
ncbi:PAAR domain-containing protein [Actinophytocola sp.]|uniref:PAAR domain-containing protein n=1 Tax=Actinophytocola sp. TaxID=1872138 RepID=UPI002ED8E692